MNTFGSSLVSCNSTDQLIWKDQICDGYRDCLNNDDEKECKTRKKNFFKAENEEGALNTE